MRAAWYELGGPAGEVLRVGEMEEPRPGAGEVLVRVRASGINPGEVKKRSDWMPRHRLPARHPPQRRCGDDRGGGRGRLHLPPRPEGAGVGRTEREVLRHRRRVRRRPRSAGRPLPDGVSFEVGACLGIPARTAHRCVFADGSVSGETVLVSGGAGAVVGFAVSFAKWGGAQVIATVGSEEHAVAALQAGADHALNYRADDVAARVAEITGGSGADRIVEVALGRNLALDTEAITQLGTIAAYSSDAEAEPRMPFWELLFKNVTIRLVGSDDLPEEAERRAVKDTATCLEAGTLRPRIGIRFPLERIAEAHEAVEGGPAVGSYWTSPSPRRRTS
jgi:NADPH:quinone reductase